MRFVRVDRDVFSSGTPAYWSGYYTTRPFWKRLARDVEARLRATELSYTFALAQARESHWSEYVKALEESFATLVEGRQVGCEKRRRREREIQGTMQALEPQTTACWWGTCPWV